MRGRNVWRLGLGLLVSGILSLAAQDSSPAVLLQQARSQQTAGEWGKAKDILSQAVQQFPQDVEVAQSYARLWRRPRRPPRFTFPVP